ncbi:hypothetical protein [Bacillus sp. 2205SS5-2]|uniref:hypothetical protein n=1 Tax=Bacillus sp. 2205SS5-2 TaxID=3109031 RepID=UPI003004D4E2
MKIPYKVLFIASNIGCTIFSFNSVLFAYFEKLVATSLNLTGVLLSITLAIFLYQKILGEHQQENSRIQSLINEPESR